MRARRFQPSFDLLQVRITPDASGSGAVVASGGSTADVDGSNVTTVSSSAVLDPYGDEPIAIGWTYSPNDGMFDVLDPPIPIGSGSTFTD